MDPMSPRPEIVGIFTRWPGWKQIGCVLLGGTLGYGCAALYHWLGLWP